MKYPDKISDIPLWRSSCRSCWCRWSTSSRPCSSSPVGEPPCTPAEALGGTLDGALASPLGPAHNFLENFYEIFEFEKIWS